jgi:hypothetical protein
MAVHSFNGTLVVSTVSATTLTSWQPFVAVTVAASPAGTVWVTTDGSTPTVGGADCEAVASGTTVVLKNLLPRPELTTLADTTGGTQPGNTVTFPAAATKVNMISSVAAVFSVSLSQNAGSATVLS